MFYGQEILCVSVEPKTEQNKENWRSCVDTSN